MGLNADQMKSQAHNFILDMAASVFLVGATIIAVVFGVIWYMSPLWLGFAEWPSGPDQRALAHTLYVASYKIGLPALLVGQILAIVLAMTGRRRAALVVAVSRSEPFPSARGPCSQ